MTPGRWRSPWRNEPADPTARLARPSRRGATAATSPIATRARTSDVANTRAIRSFMMPLPAVEHSGRRMPGDARPDRGTLVQRRPRARHLALGRTRRCTDALGDDDGPPSLARRPRARHGGSRAGPDRPRPAVGDVGALGTGDAGRRLGGARRTVNLGRDRRLSGFGDASSVAPLGGCDSLARRLEDMVGSERVDGAAA